MTVQKMKKNYYQKKAENLISALEKRNMEAFYAENSLEARNKIMELIPEKALVSWGGSMTLKEIEIFKELKKRNFQLLDRSEAETAAGRDKIYHQALSSDYYLMSSNAITQDGKLVNVDGNGNRLAALVYGPKNIIIVAGINKIAIDEETALKRVRNQAAPANALRLDLKTPCTKTGRCHNCQIEDTICCQTVITRRSRQKGRIKVIIVGENLGF